MLGRRDFRHGVRRVAGGAGDFARRYLAARGGSPSSCRFRPAPRPTSARALYAERLSALWGQPVVVDNKGGGNGIPAAEAVARAKPDGLTIFATSAMTQAVNPALYDKLPYDPIADFEPITRMGTSPFVLLVDAKSPIKSAAELTAKLKAEPGKNNFGAGALPARVASELYKMEAGVEAVYVGYKSNPQAIPDLQSGLLTFMMIDTVNAKIAIDRGALKGLFVTDTERYAAAAQPADRGRGGLSRRAADDLDRLLRAQGHAARDRAKDQCRHSQGRGHARGAGPAR